MAAAPPRIRTGHGPESLREHSLCVFVLIMTFIHCQLPDVHLAIHSLFCLSGTRMWGQQCTVPVPGLPMGPLRRSQTRYIIPPACSGSTPGRLTQKTSQRETSIPIRGPDPVHGSPLWYSVYLSSPISQINIRDVILLVTTYISLHWPKVTARWSQQNHILPKQDAPPPA